VQLISAFLIKVSSGRLALLASLLFIIFGAIVLPREAVRAERYSQGVGSPDTSLFYSTDDLYELAELYGPEGRRAYVRARYTFDLAFPLVYGFFLATTISWLVSHALETGRMLRLLNVVPVLAVLFDFLENLTTSIVMLRYPARTGIIAVLAPWLSLIKWVLVYGSFLVLALLVIYWVGKAFKQRMNSSR
jgi:hypothetical protein